MDEKTMNYWIAGVGAALAVGVTLLVVLGSQGGGSSSGGALSGLQETEAPWKPEYKFLAERVKAANIPPPGRETYHVHARMEVYVDGKKVTVPENIGLSTTPRVMSALHTHDAEGIIHIEADAPREVKLSEFFTIWGVKFSKDQIGAYRSTADKTVQVFANGKPVDDPENYIVRPKDLINVGYGAPGSVPATQAEPFPEGL